MHYLLPDNVVDEADGEDHDTDWNDLDTSWQSSLPLSLCILVLVSFKQTETSLSTHWLLSNYLVPPKKGDLCLGINIGGFQLFILPVYIQIASSIKPG